MNLSGYISIENPKKFLIYNRHSLSEDEIYWASEWIKGNFGNRIEYIKTYFLENGKISIDKLSLFEFHDFIKDELKFEERDVNEIIEEQEKTPDNLKRIHKTRMIEFTPLSMSLIIDFALLWAQYWLEKNDEIEWDVTKNGAQLGEPVLNVKKKNVFTPIWVSRIFFFKYSKNEASKEDFIKLFDVWDRIIKSELTHK